MLLGLISTSSYIIYFKFLNTHLNNPEFWFLSISPEGIGFIGMIINFMVAIIVSTYTKPPPQEVITMVEDIRQP